MRRASRAVVLPVKRRAVRTRRGPAARPAQLALMVSTPTRPLPRPRPAGASAQGNATATFANLNAAYKVQDTHTIFRAAVDAANLTDAVLNTSSFTLFIPTDAVSGLHQPRRRGRWGPSLLAPPLPLENLRAVANAR